MKKKDIYAHLRNDLDQIPVPYQWDKVAGAAARSNSWSEPAPRRRVTWKMIPLAAALAVVVVVGIVVTQLGIKPPTPIDLPLIPWNGLLSEAGGMGGGMGAVWSTSAAELHRDSPAHGRESELGTMPVYRNPSYGQALQLDTTGAMEIAEKFSKAMGKTFTYVPDTSWAEMEARIREEQPQKWQDMQEMLEANRQNEWRFQFGDEILNVTSHYGTPISLQVPLPASLPQDTDPAARYEAICQQLYNSYAAGIEALTGLRYNRVSTALLGYYTGEDNYGGKDFDTFFYVNNPDDPLAKQAEDYALNRVGVYLYEGAEEPSARLFFALCELDVENYLGHYPVMGLEAAKRELLAGHYEAVPEVTKEMLARATIEDAELIYSNSPWLSTWIPVYRFSVLFAPEDMPEYPRAVEFGVRSYYDFFVPAVPAEYLVPQAEDGNVPRPVG